MGYLGMDVAKDSLEVADATGTRGRSFPNSTAGIDTMLGWVCRSFPDSGQHLIVEPTSTYHHPLVQALVSEGLPYTLINPAHTAAYARVQGKRAKTDRVDARLLASLGESQQPGVHAASARRPGGAQGPAAPCGLAEEGASSSTQSSGHRQLFSLDAARGVGQSGEDHPAAGGGNKADAIGDDQPAGTEP